MMLPGNRLSISQHLFEGVDLLYSRNGDTNASKWLWNMELALRASLLYDVVQGAHHSPQEDAWLTLSEPTRDTQGEKTSSPLSPQTPSSSSSSISRAQAPQDADELELSSEVELKKKGLSDAQRKASAATELLLPAQLDAVVSATLLRYMEYDVAVTFKGYTASAIWRTVQNMGRRNLLTEQEEFEQQYAALEISTTESIREFFQRAKALMLKRRSGIQVTESAFVKHLLRGLRSRPEFAEARAHLLPQSLTDSLTFWGTLHYLEDREFTHRQCVPASTSALISTAVLKCTYCGRTGHEHAKCFKLHPELRKYKPKKPHSSKHSSTASAATPSGGKPKQHSEPTLASIAAALSNLEKSISALASSS